MTLTQLLPSLQPGGLGANGTSNAFNQLLAMASSKKSSATEAGQPYEVEVISGGNTERILFASADSDQRVDVKTSEKETKEPAGDNTDVTVEDPAHVQAE